ncbi:hypothetical protein CG747_36670 [Streptomyces sp. CB02959]|uniref:S-methyl thiohydantoin desulfurase domain-containing protein n=1 Tax=Streptomyces sp. CB02959 TaxID=2020330 RepID=UPI000C26FBC5|nr:DUF917 family protein [Streptomyces sp. CB02959]PJN35861.1 hypothetical protein CG747_36670 [Streptomyces sp. CB02959]
MSSPGTVPAPSWVTSTDLAHLAVGARVLAAGTEECAYRVALHWASAEIAAHGPVPLLPADRLDATGLCLTLTLAGASAALAEQLPTGDEPVKAVRAVERVVGRTAQAVVALNTAAENALIALAAAARLGLPLVDGDGCGRVMPLLEQTTFTLAGNCPAPLALATCSGDVIAVESAGSSVEELVRPLVLAAGGWAVVAAYPLEGADLARCLVPGTVSRALAAGAATERERFTPWRPRRLCRGRIAAVEQPTSSPYGVTLRPSRAALPSTPTSVIVTEAEGLRRRFRLEAHNEVLLALADGAVAAAAPDQILILSAADGRVVDVERAVPGTEVEIVVLESVPAWHTPEGRALARVGALAPLESTSESNGCSAAPAAAARHTGGKQ